MGDITEGFHTYFTRENILADDADISDERIQIAVSSMQAEISNRGPEAEVTGYCLSCGPGTPVEHPKRWCDSACREDWKRSQDMLKLKRGR